MNEGRRKVRGACARIRYREYQVTKEVPQSPENPHGAVQREGGPSYAEEK